MMNSMNRGRNDMNKGITARFLMMVLSAALLMPARAQLPDFTKLAAEATGAVVSVRASSNNNGQQRANPRRPRDFIFPFPPELFERRNRPQQTQGSGFIIDSEGYVLTNAHVVEHMTRIAVILKDGTEYVAEVVGRDPHTDIALLKIESETPLPIVQIGDSDNVKVGQWVAAVGSPYGLDQSVTAGIISALQRQLPSDRYVPFIQTDAAVNPGNSGGPLMDLEGNVIGINSQIVSPVQAFVGASFAIPINVAMNIQARLRTDGEIRRGWLGVYFSPLTEPVAEAYGLSGYGSSDRGGVLINQVIEGSPAEDAGVQNGDIILRINQGTIDANSLPRIIADLTPGELITISVWRDGEMLELEAELKSLDGETALILGLKVEDINDEIKRRTGLKFGVIVREVRLDGDAPDDIRNIRPGDIITHMLVNERRRPIHNRRDMSEALEENRKNAEIFYIWREGRNFAVTIRR